MAETRLDKLKETIDDNQAKIGDRIHALLLLLRSRKTKEENHEDQSPNDKELIPQLQVPISKLEHGLRINNASPTDCEDSQCVVGFDGLFGHEEAMLKVSDVQARAVVLKKSEGVTNNQVAHQLFDKMPSKEKRIKHIKGWRFKFKRKNLTGITLQSEQYKVMERRRRRYKKFSTNIKDESMRVLITGNHRKMVRQLHVSRVQCKMRMMNDSWSMKELTLKVMKFHRKHKWKSKHLQIASNFWINRPHKLADLVLRTALTDWRTKSSKGLAYDGCVILEMNFAGFGIGKTELLATSQKMQKMDLFSFCCFCKKQILVGIHTEIEENLEFQQLLAAVERFSQEVIEELAKRIVIEQKIEGDLICGDVKFHLKHKRRFRLLESFSRLVLLAWINLWFSKAYEFSGQLQDSTNGEAESFPFLNFVAEQPLLWLQNNSEPILVVSELERKKKLGYKTWMFKYKAPLKRVQFLHYCDKEVPKETNWAVQRIWDKDSHEVDIIDAYSVLQDVSEMVNKQLLKISLVLQQVMRSKNIKFPKRWMFKYKYVEEGIKRLHNQLRYKKIQRFMIAKQEEMEDDMKEDDQKQQGDWGHSFLLIAVANQSHIWNTSCHFWHRWKARWFFVGMISTMRAWLFGEEGFDIGKETRRVAHEIEVGLDTWTAKIRSWDQRLGLIAAQDCEESVKRKQTTD